MWNWQIKNNLYEKLLPNLLSRMNNIDPKRIDRVSPNVIAINSGDQNLPFMVVNKKPPDHDGDVFTNLNRH